MKEGPAQPIPARDDVSEFSTFDRGSLFLASLEDIGITVAGLRVADLGTGFGSIAIAAARSGARQVIAVDANRDRLTTVRERARTAGVALETLQANLLEPATFPPVDVAFLIGVVEYAGLWDARARVEDLQRRVFRAAFDSLDSGGVLIFGSKNRLWPPFLLKDVHTGLPVVNFLPRRAADAVSRVLDGKEYRHYIHSPRRWEAALSSVGFRSITRFFPYFSYQFPIRIVSKPAFRQIPFLKSRISSAEEATAALGRFWLGKATLMAGAGLVNLPLSHSIILKAQK